MTTVTIDSVRYSLSGTVASVTGSSSPPNPWNLVIPSTVSNLGITYNVTSIGNSALLNLTILKSITIPNSVTSIGNSVFQGCSGLTSITIPNSVTSIGTSVFYNCTGLTSIIIPNSVISIGTSTFQNCSGLTSITIPNSVTSIGNGAIQGCTSLRSITIPNLVTTIGTSAFQSCSGLTSITIPNSVTSIGNIAFQDCSGLTSITISSSVANIGSSVFQSCSGLTSITIPNSVTSISNNAFQSCSGLTSITISNSVKSIGASVFQSCTGLTSITIPGSVTSIGSIVFFGCTSLLSIIVASNNANYSSLDGVLFNKLQTTLVSFPNGKGSSYTIPSLVTSIGNNAFQGCTGLTSITIPSLVASIGTSVFQGCTALLSIIVASNNANYSSLDGVLFNKLQTTLVSFPNGKGSSYTIPSLVTNIGNTAFQGFTGLTSITIPNSVTNISDDVFKSCSGLTSITIPNSVTNIGNYAFQDCTSLTSIIIPSSVASIGGVTFQGCTSLTSVTIANGQLTGIASPATNSSFFGKNGLVRLLPPTFTDNNVLYSYTLNSGIASVIPSPSASGSLTILSSFIFDNVTYNVTSIGVNAFKSCSGLTSITIPNSVTSISNTAFQSCTGLTSITIPSLVASIGANAFQSCTGLTSITIPSLVASIGANAFQSCTGLTSITINSFVTNLASAFSGLNNTNTSWVFDYSGAIPDSVCNGKTGVTSVTIGSLITSIGTSVFQGCTGLKSITINSFVTNLASAFSGVNNTNTSWVFDYSGAIPDSVCNGKTGVTSVTIGSLITSIGTSVFQGCTGLTSITIPSLVASIGKSVFQGCSGLTSIIVDSNNANYSSLDGVLFNKLQTTLVSFPNGKGRSYTIPNLVTNIGNTAFQGFTGLTSITIPNSVTNISDDAFKSCSGLTSITIPNSVISIGTNAFYSCTGLTSITISNSVTTIGTSAFQYCSGLTSITLPSSVTTIGNYAFNGCYNLRNIVVNSFLSNLGMGFFALNNSNSSWTFDYSGAIPDGACNGRTSVTSVSIGNQINSISAGAFQTCSGLTSITIPSAVTSIGQSAFQSCSGLTSITFLPSSSLTTIGDSVFNGCSKLQNIPFPPNIISLGAGIFTNSPARFIATSSFLLPSQIQSNGIYTIPSPAKPLNSASTWSYTSLNTNIATIFLNKIVSDTSGTVNITATLPSDSLYTTIVLTATTSITFNPTLNPSILNPGDLDPTFGTGGLVVTDFSNNTDQGWDVKIQPDGKIIVGGQASIGGNNNFALAKYNVDGSLDASFGTGGLVTTDFSNGSDIGRSLVIQPDGKIVVGGQASIGGNNNFALAKYNVDGSLDTSFGTGGRVNTDFFNGSDVGRWLAIQPDGKIILVGSSTNVAAGGNNFGMARYDTSGNLDTSFGTGGKVDTDFFNGFNAAFSVAIQSDEKIIVGGYATNTVIAGGANFALARYNTNGTLDASFGTQGKVDTDFSNNSDIGYSIAIQPDNKIILGGRTDTTNGNFGLARYNSNGSLDTSFGVGGIVTTDFYNWWDTCYSVALQPDGKIILGGYASINPLPNDFALARYNSNGTLDTSFGTNGKVITDFGGGDDTAYSLAIQPDSNIIIAGYAFNGFNNDFALARYIGNPVSPIVPICFPAGTPVQTDQGSIAIEQINPSTNTIRDKKIVAITKTVTIEDSIVCIEKDALGSNIPSQKTFISRNHKLLYNKKMIKAKELIGNVEGIYNKKYNGEILYNVLFETHENMIVNNLIVETLHPENIVAKLYNGSLTETERNNTIIKINKCANDYKKLYGKLS